MSLRFALLAVFCCTSCAPAMAKLPLGPVSEPGFAAVSPESAFDSCQNTSSAAGQLDIAGTIARQRVRWHFLYAVIPGLGVRIESRDTPDDKRIVFASVDDERGIENVTLLLPKRNAVVKGNASADILGAVMGLPLPAMTWQRLLVCPLVPGASVWEWGDLFSNGWLRARGQGRDAMTFGYYRPARKTPWELVTMIGRPLGTSSAGWRADFHDPTEIGWRTVRLTSLDWAGQIGNQYDVVLTVVRNQVNTLNDPVDFTIDVPPAARPLTLVELRETNLLLSKKRR